MKNEVLVQLMDAFSNPILSQQTKLAFQIDSVNSSSFMRWAFADNEDGSYIGYYLARDLGAYNICISFEDKNLPPCPFEIHVHESKSQKQYLYYITCYISLVFFGGGVRGGGRKVVIPFFINTRRPW